MAVLLLPDVALGADGPSAPPPDQAAGRFAEEVVPFLKKHCYACHGDGKRRADLALDRYPDGPAALKAREVWENVLEMVQGGLMPPMERPRPAAAEADRAIRALEGILAADACTGAPGAGRVTLRRLNRAEYNNTIRDLVGVDFRPAADFPEDDVGYGFDNIGDVLSLSPLLLEKYLAAAETILDQAIVIAEAPRPMETRLGSLRVSPNAAGEPRRGGAAVYARGAVVAQNYFDEGEYVIRVEAYGQAAGGEPVRAALRVGRDVSREFEAKGDRSAPTTIEEKVRLKTGTASVAVSFLNPARDPDPRAAAESRRALVVLRIVVDGPYNAPPPPVPESHRRIMAHRDGLPPRAAARAIVDRFATRAFRRPVRPEEVERILELYDQAEGQGERFEDCVRLALARILVAPDFLFRVELDPPGARPGTAYPIGEYELASRLSYFLWSSMPDEDLFALAAQGRLRRDLEAQVRRMLRDPKSRAFVQDFAGQWLTLRKLATVTPDPELFPEFDDALRAAMVRESELFFEAVLREDRSLLDFLAADFSFVNERLAQHYGISGVKGEEFRRVKLPANRGGILTQASILTLTSHPTRTSPVLRGKWVLDQLLNTPPPPPPPDVPPLPEGKQLTGSLRRVMELHRENALCASCHRRMDPIGFAFENYDAVGAWRDRDGPFAIDPSGELPDGRSFRGPAELKALLKGGDSFARALTEKVLTYALGRGLESSDRCAVDAILEALARDEYRFSTLLLEVIQSEPFQMRTVAGGEP